MIHEEIIADIIRDGDPELFDAILSDEDFVIQEGYLDTYGEDFRNISTKHIDWEVVRDIIENF